MSKIGFLNVVPTASGTELRGEIKTLQMHVRLKFVENRNKANDNAPTYIVTSPTDGGDIAIGGAWLQRKQQVGDVEFEFLSITLDDPSFPNALNVAAFKNSNGGWDITWRRRQDKE